MNHQIFHPSVIFDIIKLTNPGVANSHYTIVCDHVMYVACVVEPAVKSFTTDSDTTFTRRYYVIYGNSRSH